MLKKYIEYANLLNLIIGKGEILSDWEYKFAKDILEKLNKGQGQSDKVLAKIKDIWDRLEKKEYGYR